MDKRLLIAGAALGLFGVIIGAFATHGLRPHLNADAVNSFETGVKYQLYHAFLLLIIGGFNFLENKLKSIVLYLLVGGILLFSGSIYLLATNDLSGIDFREIALLTPLGGSLLIAAWFVILVAFFKLKKK